MQGKKFIRDYLSFSRKERLGILCLFGLICTIYILPGFLIKKQPFPLKDSNLLAHFTDSLGKASNPSEEFENPSISTHYEPRTPKAFSEGELFQFDPNNLQAEGWRRLGLSERTTKTIMNYTSKGGKFRSAEDLQKIWGIPAGFYDRVKGLVSIEVEVEAKNKNEYPAYKKTERKFEDININDADTSAFISLPGIGSKLALRLVTFREKLGGFYSVDQVKEVYGLQDSTFQKIKKFLQISGEVKKININTATKDDLKTHPYIKWNIANAIVEYRNQHGNFQSIVDLKKVSLVTEEVANKLQAYVEF